MLRKKLKLFEKIVYTRKGEESENKKANGTCIGMPEIVPGRFLKISDVDSLINKKFYVTDVTHTINYNGFLTSFAAEGWE